MTPPKLKKVLSILCGQLSKKGVPHAIIDAMALSLYGMPRFTADIDLLSDDLYRKIVLELMKRLGYDCFQDAGNFAQFDSELGVYGKVDFMFVNTEEGRAILGRTVDAKDEAIGLVPVVQPTDYAVLKLMAMANNPERKARDMADLEILFKSAAAGFLDTSFQPINVDHLQKFAGRFHVSKQLASLLPLLGPVKHPHRGKTDE
ncbi:MAG: nucleotidyl transferase AbiEii/AbiGii toxin family protein [Desulfobacteraceae bacterium]|nr:nucleotidyl transferase AbiEii/AbiGii toxin family protein [Desulfobacteraceae bacterium]